MDKFLTFLENSAVRSLTKRKAKKEYKKNKKKTFLNEVLEWLDAIVFAIFWVIIINQYLFQLFVIPSPSMVSTLLVGDRVVVNKDAYGVELITGGKKILNEGNRVQRDDIITFYNPEYESRGPVFDILAQIIYMGTLSLVNIDKDSDGNPRERLLVKRACGLGGDEVYFDDGNVYIKAAGTNEYVKEEVFREKSSLTLAPERTIDSSLYPSLKAAAVLTSYSENGINLPNNKVELYSKIQNTEYDYKFDLYEYNREYNKTNALINPQDSNKRSEYAKYRASIYVPEGKVLPLGDNRDNSLDGRYFGPVSESRINGRVIFRFWPLKRISVLTNK